MKKVLISVLLTAGLAVSLNVSAQGNAEAGKDKVAVCAGCHGADGNSAVGSFPKLAGQGAKYLNKQLHDIKSGARPIVEMTGLLDGLSDQDLLDISAFYASQAIVIGQANKDLAEKGSVIYRAGIPEKNVAACMACHGPSGTGIDLATFPALGGQHAEYTASQLKKFRVGERSNDGDTLIMRSIAARLSDREIEAVSAYISGLYE